MTTKTPISGESPEAIRSDDDLPGMLMVALKVRAQEWPHTMDAQVWAQEWAKALNAHPWIAHDTGAMIGWFANAIMAGFDAAIARQNGWTAESPGAN